MPLRRRKDRWKCESSGWVEYLIHILIRSQYDISDNLIVSLQLEEELRDTQKKMMQVENDLDKAQEELTTANANLVEKEKKVQEVSS